jgi:hypothetical protein
MISIRTESNAGVPGVLGEARIVAMRARQTAPSSGGGAMGVEEATDVVAAGVADAVGVGSHPEVPKLNKVASEAQSTDVRVGRMGLHKDGGAGESIPRAC